MKVNQWNGDLTNLIAHAEDNKKKKKKKDCQDFNIGF